MALTEHTDYYFNSDGLMVLTGKYLAERGYCCGNGCKHCPFDYESVPEPKKAELVLARLVENELADSRPYVPNA